MFSLWIIVQKGRSYQSRSGHLLSRVSVRVRFFARKGVLSLVDMEELSTEYDSVQL